MKVLIYCNAKCPETKWFRPFWADVYGFKEGEEVEIRWEGSTVEYIKNGWIQYTEESKVGNIKSTALWKKMGAEL